MEASRAPAGDVDPTSRCPLRAPCRAEGAARWLAHSEPCGHVSSYALFWAWLSSRGWACPRLQLGGVSARRRVALRRDRWSMSR